MAELWTWVGVPLLIFTARALDVSLGTLRIVLVYGLPVLKIRKSRTKGWSRS